jgi:hypothetical protein
VRPAEFRCSQLFCVPGVSPALRPDPQSFFLKETSVRQILTDAACKTKPPRNGRLEIADLRQAGLVLRITSKQAMRSIASLKATALIFLTSSASALMRPILTRFCAASKVGPDGGAAGYEPTRCREGGAFAKSWRRE